MFCESSLVLATAGAGAGAGSGTPDAKAPSGGTAGPTRPPVVATAAGCAFQLACADQNESYVSAMFAPPNAVGPTLGDGGTLIGKGELETYAFAR